MPSYKTISARIELPTILEVEKIAKVKDLTVTQIVRKLLREYVRRNGGTNGNTQQSP